MHIQYICPRCGQEWEEEWDCACDSECPRCGEENIQASSFQEDEEDRAIDDGDLIDVELNYEFADDGPEEEDES